ncbi:MAG: aminotransferase class IV [Phycisphaerae bacterium]
MIIMKELAYLNGIYCPIDQAMVSIEDRGYLFGDGVYEVVACYHGKPFLLDAHLARLRKSLAAVRIDYDWDQCPFEPIIEQGLRKSAMGRRGMVYIQITRGTEARSHVYGDGLTPTVVLTFKPMEPLSAARRQRGVHMMTAEDIRWAHCFIKAITLLPNVLVKNEATRKGFDDAIFVTPTGEVRECTSANVFIANDGVLTMPPRTRSVLHGVTQGFLIQCAEGIGLKVREASFDVATMMSADEVFLSSTTVEVLGVTQIDGRAVADGKVGATTQRLYREFRKRADALSQGETSMAG